MFPGTVPQGIGIIGGAVSGLETFDVDDGAAWEAYRTAVEKQAPGLLDRVPQVQSPREGGGRHLYVFSDSAGGCCTLAADEEEGRDRGKGGWRLLCGAGVLAEGASDRGRVPAR